jgi:hypothetical protein
MANEMARKTGNQGFRPVATGPISRKLARQALDVKVVAARIIDHPAAVEELVAAANAVLAEVDRVARLETHMPVVVVHVTDAELAVN